MSYFLENVIYYFSTYITVHLSFPIFVICFRSIRLKKPAVLPAAIFVHILARAAATHVARLQYVTEQEFYGFYYDVLFRYSSESRCWKLDLEKTCDNDCFWVADRQNVKKWSTVSHLHHQFSVQENFYLHILLQMKYWKAFTPISQSLYPFTSIL